MWWDKKLYTLELFTILCCVCVCVCVCRNIECVDMMVGIGCEVNTRDKLGRTPLHYAASTAQYQCVLSLVANGADLTAVDKLDRTPLHYAAAADADAKWVRENGGYWWARGREKIGCGFENFIISVSVLSEVIDG